MNPHQTTTDTVVLPYGTIRGIALTEEGARAWLGVPYARPPVGELRWKAPRESEPWVGVRETRDYGPPSIQGGPDGIVGSEDCLYLNIWRPDHAATGLPVFVYLHGGGNIGGSGRDFPGGGLAVATDSIIVTVNYRLGAMGFLRHPALRTGDPLDDSGNYGLLDAIQALRWVQAQIACFGGDPAKVTLGGQSAGARNALAAYLSPLGRGLFQQLFVLSGGMTTAPGELGEARADEVLAELLQAEGIAPDRAAARDWAARQSAKTIADFLRGLEADRFVPSFSDTGLRMRVFPHLFEDGVVLPLGGFASLDARAHPPLPVILGSTATEFSGFALGDPVFQPLTQPDSEAADEALRTSYALSSAYGSELYAAFNVEAVADRLSQLHPDMPIYGYRFRWGLREGVIPPAVRWLLGAPHGADVPFYTGDYTDMLRHMPQGTITERNLHGRTALASQMRGYLRRFLHTGDPNGDDWIATAWPRWGSDACSSVLQLDGTAHEAVIGLEPRYAHEDTLARLAADDRLTPEQHRWLQEHLFAGRFFWVDRE